MITPEQIDFQTPDDAPFDWCETNFFSFNIPEHNILGMLYMLSRPKLGVCMSDITIQDRISQSWEDQLYVDNRQHLPCPPSLRSYKLENGLSVDCVEPLKRYVIDYEGGDETRIYLEAEALMPPFDINDPAMDPMAARRPSSQWAFAGHYELTCRVQGEMTVRGRTLAIDCVDTFDRSWSVRSEVEKACAVWLHASFGPSLTIHLLCDYQPGEPERWGKLLSGYVLEDGQVYGIAEATGQSRYAGIMSMSTRFEITDVRGKSFTVTGGAISASRWQPYSTMVYPQSLMEWNLDGRIGYGVQQDAASRAAVCRYRDVMRP